jgi:hypothetical protein
MGVPSWAFLHGRSVGTLALKPRGCKLASGRGLEPNGLIHQKVDLSRMNIVDGSNYSQFTFVYQLPNRLAGSDNLLNAMNDVQSSNILDKLRPIILSQRVDLLKDG